MAELVFNDASVTLNGVDLSSHTKSVTITYTSALQEVTAMGDTTVARIGGIKDWNIAVELNQDYAAAQVDETLFPLVGTSFPVVVKPTSAAVSAENPSYSGTGILESYTPVGGAVGEVAATSITIQAAGDLTRATA